jgi:hypothetical protein
LRWITRPQTYLPPLEYFGASPECGVVLLNRNVVHIFESQSGNDDYYNVIAIMLYAHGADR